MFLSFPVWFWTSVAYENSSTFLTEMNLRSPEYLRGGPAELSLAITYKTAKPTFQEMWHACDTYSQTQMTVVTMLNDQIRKLVKKEPSTTSMFSNLTETTITSERHQLL